MVRNERSLAGVWQFQVDPEGQLQVGSLSPDREITVPMPWQAVFPELQQYSGFAWYRRYIELDGEWLGGELIVHFGAVDYWCQVFVNQQLVGEHEGGYTPFDVSIRAQVHPGQNEIAIRVYDAAQDSLVIERWYGSQSSHNPTHPPFDPRQIPHGKQEWYINAGGIWQDVILRALPTTYIDQVAITPKIATGEAQVRVTLGSMALQRIPNLTLHVRIEGTTAEQSSPLLPNKLTYNLDLKVDQPRLWTMDDPALYTAKISLAGNGLDDNISIRFGFREISTSSGQLLLNGKPFFLLSALDQDLYPETICTVPSEGYLRDQFLKAKALGLNSLRCHIKPPDPRYLDLADELGLLIWEEIPSWRTFYIKTTVHDAALNLDNALRDRVRQTLDEMIQRDFNHPSLMIYTIVNEDWGTALPLRAEDRAWVAEMFAYCKKLDATRLVVDNSACLSSWGPNIHVHSDLEDFHIYANIPDQAETFKQIIEQFALHPLWTYSSNGDTQRTGDEPLILSEFGNWGLPQLSAIQQADGQEPAWFDLGPWWSAWEGEPGWPQDVRQRFNRLGLNVIWPDFDTFATATQWHQFQAMKYQIEIMRRQTSIAGYVITELTDTYWESNGLLDFNRGAKAYFAAFTAINSPDVIVPIVERYVYWSDEQIRVKLIASHYSQADWSQVHVTCEETGSTHNISLLSSGLVQELVTESIAVPQVTQAENAHYNFSADAGDQRLARNTLDVLILPATARQAGLREEVAVMVRRDQIANEEANPANVAHVEVDSAVASDTYKNSTASFIPSSMTFQLALHYLGYQTHRRITSNTRALVTDYPDREMLRWVREGGTMLYLSSSVGSPFFWRQSRGGAYSGNWITSFSWLRPGIYKRLLVDNPLKLPFEKVMPTGTIVGLPYEDAAVQADFLAGQIGGWIQHPAIHTVQFRYGRGRVIMTTFALQESLLNRTPDPIGIAMFHDLIDHLVSEACQPILTANY